MRILVCGGRDFGWKVVDRCKVINEEEIAFLKRSLDELAAKHSSLYVEDDNWLPMDITIITGGAPGADCWAFEWAVVNWADSREFPADWKKHGRAAGPIRNSQMLVEGKPDLVVAFPGGVGTADMVKKAKRAKIPTICY